MNDAAEEEAALGLTSEEVQMRIAAGEVNVDAGVKTRSVGQIVHDNICTLFNLVNAVLALIINFIRTLPTFIRTCADECGKCSDEVDNQGQDGIHQVEQRADVIMHDLPDRPRLHARIDIDLACGDTHLHFFGC